MAAAQPSPGIHDGRTVHDITAQIIENVSRVIDGKRPAVETALIVLLAQGHLLLEDVPGVGKTMLARSLAKTLHGSIHRIQFTPDLLPSDITGVTTFNNSANTFEFKPGPIFSNLVIADEINRASPKTQSALLESMEELQVSVDGNTYRLPEPFTVIATQNPVEMEGTFPLPEAQRDRFMARLSLGYPDFASEVAMLHDRASGNPLDEIEPACTIEEFRVLIKSAKQIYTSPLIEQYVVSVVQATRQHPALRLGASPRATIQLVRAAKARALLEERDYVIPDDIVALAPSVLPHRLLPSRSVTSGSPEEVSRQVIAEILATVPVPGGSARNR